MSTEEREDVAPNPQQSALTPAQVAQIKKEGQGRRGQQAADQRKCVTRRFDASLKRLLEQG